MNLDRIKELQKATACPDSISVMLALEQVWHETATEGINCEDCHNNALRLAAGKGIINTETVCDICKFNPKYKSEFIKK